ncbi:MAG TPA: hypothetical protein VM123_13270 [archaeon]|nr:hypothetical protein [archaeon]
MRFRACLISLFLLAALLFSACGREGVEGAKKTYPYRWFYMSSSLNDDSQVEEIRQVVKTASEHGLNGMLLSAGLDRISLQGPDYFRRLEEVQNICREYKVEIIPSVFSIGYGSAVLSHNKNLAAGIPVLDALFVASGGEVKLVADPPVSIANGSFENYEGNRVSGYTYSGEPGQVISVDNKIFKEGKSSLRFENFDQYPREAGRMSQEITVKPYRCYSLSVWIKSEGMDPSMPFGSGNLQVLAFGPDGRQLHWININVPPSGDWFKAQLGFNSLSYDKVKISISTGRGKSGKFWIDDLRVGEAGLLNVLRRPGTPVTVRGEKNGTVYEEGRDYAPISDPELNFSFDHDGPPIRLLPDSRITEGERLRVSWYHGISVHDGQVSVCMSEPEIYDIYRTETRLIHEHLAPKKYFLPQDEIRAGGSCQACRERNLTMGQILGDCVTRQVDIIRENDPQAEIFIWSDMLDPNHNARVREGNYYYHVDGSFTESWNYVPKDLIIACWGRRARIKTLSHFSGLGFRTLAAAYYDADNLEDISGWLEALDNTPDAVGIMYTTWLEKYALLAEFGDLVSRKK